MGKSEKSWYERPVFAVPLFLLALFTLPQQVQDGSSWWAQHLPAWANWLAGAAVKHLPRVSDGFLWGLFGASIALLIPFLISRAGVWLAKPEPPQIVFNPTEPACLKLATNNYGNPYWALRVGVMSPSMSPARLVLEKIDPAPSFVQSGMPFAPAGEHFENGSMPIEHPARPVYFHVLTAVGSSWPSNVHLNLMAQPMEVFSESRVLTVRAEAGGLTDTALIRVWIDSDIHGKWALRAERINLDLPQMPHSQGGGR